MFSLNLNYMGVILVIVSATFEHEKSFILSRPETPRWPLNVKYASVLTIVIITRNSFYKLHGQELRASDVAK